MKIELPVIDGSKKWWAAVIWYLFFCIGYLVSGNFHFREPFELELSDLDRVTPFIGWTVWIYLSQYLLLLFCAFFAKTSRTISRMAWSISMASLISFIIFLIFPTAFPRPTIQGNDVEKVVFSLLYSIDSPTNCFPSLHVSIAWLTAINLRDEKKRIGNIALAWATAITLSTLTTKQHYFVDLLGAAILIFLCHRVLTRLQ